MWGVIRPEESGGRVFIVCFFFSRRQQAASDVWLLSSVSIPDSPGAGSLAIFVPLALPTSSMLRDLALHRREAVVCLHRFVASVPVVTMASWHDLSRRIGLLYYALIG